MAEKPSPVAANTFSHFLHQSATERHTDSHTLSHIHTRSAAKIYLPLTDYY